jgi:hypothetical protein
MSVNGWSVEMAVAEFLCTSGTKWRRCCIELNWSCCWTLYGNCSFCA